MPHQMPRGPKAPALLVQQAQCHALFGLQLCVSCSHLCNLPYLWVLHFGVENTHLENKLDSGYLILARKTNP